MAVQVPELARSRMMLVLYGFALGVAVGIVLESSGALAGLDRAIGRRLARSEPPGAATAAPEEVVRAEERPSAA